MIELVTVGWLTTDDIVLEDGTTFMATPGGGALYSAVGASIWTPSVGIHAPAGIIHAKNSRHAIEEWGLDTRGIADVAGNGLELWLLHESDVHKQQIRKLSSADPLALDAARGPLPDEYRRARGFHIAPQSPASSLRMVETLKAPGRVLTMDILADAMIDAGRYRDLGFLSGLHAFLPSEAEIERIWSPNRIEDWLSDTARGGGTTLIGKIGSRGSLLAEPESGPITHIPAYPADVVDTTGSGDAFCGGFLAGLVSGRSPVEAAAMGTVSASYVVEARGALATMRPAREDRDARLEKVQSGVVQI